MGANCRNRPSKAAPPRPAAKRYAHALFRSRFDSAQARQTVRQGCFRGLEFAPVFAAKPQRRPRLRRNFPAHALRTRTPRRKPKSLNAHFAPIPFGPAMG